MQSNVIHFKNEPIKYDGKLSELSKIWFKNLFFTLLTLGFYRFWGKTKLRQYLVGCHSLGGERFVYTGTAVELFYGFFRAILYLVPCLVLILIDVFYNVALSVFGGIYILYLSKYFAYGRLQYLNARTKWKGIYGALTGSRRKYAKEQLISFVFSFFSARLFTPYLAIDRQEYAMKHYSFGGLHGIFNRKQHKLISRRLYGRILAIPTLGYSLAWYKRLEKEYIYNNSKIGGVQLAYTATTNQLYKLYVQSLLLFVFTLGLAIPVIIHLQNQFKSKFIRFSGTIDIDQLIQHRVAIDAKLDDGASIINDGVDLALG